MQQAQHGWLHSRGATLQGPILDGELCGVCTLTVTRTGEVYTGPFRHMEFYGWCERRSRSGAVLAGTIQGGQFVGRCTHTYNGITIHGEYVDGSFGKCTVQLPNGSVYDGKILDGYFCGTGTIVGRGMTIQCVMHRSGRITGWTDTNLSRVECECTRAERLCRRGQKRRADGSIVY